MSRGIQGGKDAGIELLTSRVLLAGVATAAAVVFIGGLVFLARHGSERVELFTFQGEPASLRRPLEILAQAAAFRGRGLIQMGLLLLICTPIMRVGFSVYAFARQRDYAYVAITLVVLAILTCGLMAEH